MANQNHPRNDIRFMDPLCWLGNVLAITPPRSVLKQSDNPKSKFLYKVYAIFMLLVVIIGSGLSIFGRSAKAYPSFPSATLIVTDLAVILSTTVTNVAAIIVPSFFRFGIFKIFYELFTKSEDCLPKEQWIKVKKCKAFYIELAVGHFVLLVICIFDASVWVPEAGFAVYRYYIFRNFQCYHVFITAMMMYNFALSMRYRFEKINEELRKLNNIITCSTPRNNSTSIQAKVDSNYENVRIVREVALLYEKHIMQIKLFNDTYGWQILFMALSTMMGLLNCWDMITVSVFTRQKQKTIEAYGCKLIILSSLWALWQLVTGAVVVISCSKAERTAKETADVCFNQLLKLPLTYEVPQHRTLRDELQLLCQLAIHRSPPFSAAGFFTVDFSLLLAIFGSVTSYIIVLIQFK